MYATTINQNGMILLNKAAREALGLHLGDRVVVNFTKKSATVERDLTDDEFFAKLDSLKSASTKASIARHSGASASDLMHLAISKVAQANERED